MKRHYVATAPDGTKFTCSTEREYTHAALVWFPGLIDQVLKWHINSFCESEALAVKAAAALQKFLGAWESDPDPRQDQEPDAALQKFIKPEERVKIVEAHAFTPLTDRQREFLLEIGDKTIEVLGTSHLVALVKRGLVARSFIGQRVWRVRRTKAGHKAVEGSP